jgi:hypothetical protein
MMETRVLLGTAPMTVSSFWPFLKIITVGMLRMPYSVATPGDSSVFSFSCGCRRRVRNSQPAGRCAKAQNSSPEPQQRRQPRCLGLHSCIARGGCLHQSQSDLTAALAPLPPPDRCLPLGFNAPAAGRTRSAGDAPP